MFKVVPFLFLSMGVEGASVVSTATVATNTAGWTNWTAAQLSSSNDSRADTGTNTSATGTVSGFLFSSVPSSALIQGFVVTLEASESNTAVNGYLLTAISSNSGTSYSAYYRSPDSGEFPTADTSYTEGGASDLWGLSWTVNAATANLRVKIVAYDASGTGGNVTRLDYVTTTIYFDSAPPTACSTLNSVQSSTSASQANLTWTASGEDGSTGTLNGNFRIQYATYTASWSTSTTPSGATTVTIATTSVTPGTTHSRSISGLTLPTTYYFVLWTQDASSRWSNISNTTSTFMDATSPSTSTLAATAGMGQVTLNWNSAGDDGSSGNLTGNYRIQHATYTATWSTSTTPSNATTVTVSTTDVTPGAGLTYVASGLTAGTTRYFALFTQDDVGNWSGVSNTTSAVPTSQFDLNQIEVDGLNGGLKYGGVAWGDFDIDGDLDILVSGNVGVSSAPQKIRVYFNNGNGTFNPDEIAVAGAQSGLVFGDVNWGDFDNDGDLDILECGRTTSISTYGKNIRVFSNNGNSTFNPTPLDLAGANGLDDGTATWGDFDNDGDLDVLANGLDKNSFNELRVYTNSGNATFQPNPIDIDGLHGGYGGGESIWGDFDGDGDLDIAVDGTTISTQQYLSVYKNNGNGTFNPVEIWPLGFPGFVQGRLAWGDYDNDADLDLLMNGGSNYLHVARNNGNGTFNSTPDQLESGGAAVNGSVAWGDCDLDGDLDILTMGNTSLTNQLRVYINSGISNFSRMEVDGLNNGISYGGVAWGDHDSDGDIDILCSGKNDSEQLRVYNNLFSTPNTPPAAPTGLGATWSHNGAGISTATLKWSPASDSGIGATPANVLTYQVEVSTSPAFSGLSVAPGQWATPGMGNYLRPPLIYDGNTKHGVRLTALKQTNTTYYFRVKTIDAGLESSDWSATSSVYTLVASSVPSAVVNLATASVQLDGQLVLTWTAPLNINAGGSGSYDVRYSTTGAVSNDTQFNNATAITGEPTPGNPGFFHVMSIRDLNPYTTYYFAIKSSNAMGTSLLDISSPEPSARPSFFDSTQIDVGGSSGGMRYSDVSWGDFDNDGDLDVFAMGQDSDGYGIKIYKNNGNGTIDDMEINVAGGINNGLYIGAISLGDCDNDGDLDIAVVGYNNSTSQFRLYINNGNGTINSNHIEVDGVNNGLYNGDVAWGDVDNDGDLDLAVSGEGGQTGGRQLSIYKNNGNGTINPLQVDIEGPANGLQGSSLAWGDFDKEGDLDLLVQGGELTFKQRRIYKNNGNGTLDASQIEVNGLNNGLYYGETLWGDFDADGDLDVLSVGEKFLHFSVNNGNGTINPTRVTLTGGSQNADVDWGDYDNDGALDILVSGTNFYENTGDIKTLKNNGNGTFSTDLNYVDGKDIGILRGKNAWGDFDNDGDIDILASGETTYSTVLGIYKNNAQLGRTNTAPSAPSSLTSSWAFGGTSLSTATFKWSPATDSGVGSTPANGLTYLVEISSTSSFLSRSVVPAHWVTPGMGNYLNPPKIFDGNTTHGVMLHSLPFTNTTYYFRVKSIDAGLKPSPWSSTGSLYTAVASSVPVAISDLSDANNISEGQGELTWTAPFNIQSGANATYDIRFSTTAAITNDSQFNSATSIIGEPIPGYTGVVERMFVTGLTPYVTHYFAIKSSNSIATSALDLSNPRPYLYARPFNASEIAVAGYAIAPTRGAVAWGDFDMDDDIDVLVSGFTKSLLNELLVFKNNGNGSFDANPAYVCAAGGWGLDGRVAWGDFDNDGDLDVVASASVYPNVPLGIYSNNGNGTFDQNAMELDQLWGGGAPGDFDNDGDLDVLGNGATGISDELRVYKNNGNGFFEDKQIDVDGPDGGNSDGDVAWGDFDNDGDLDILATGYFSSTYRLSVYKNGSSPFCVGQN